MKTKEIHTEVVVVGSGAGGATLAKELSTKGKKVIVVGKGPHVKKVGSEFYASKFYDGFGLLSKSEEGVIIYRTIMKGGTTVVSCGNGVRALERELQTMSINLEEEFKETERELGVMPISDRLIGKGGSKIRDAAEKLGIKMKPMPKFINPKRCISCGRCVLGCPRDSKWTALKYLKQARDNGASIITKTNITEVIISNGQAKGVRGRNPITDIEIYADKVILAAGGIGTPIILQKSGIKEAGKRLFCDLFNVTYGVLKEDIEFTKELTMSVVTDIFRERDGFILSPFIDPPLVFTSLYPLRNFLRLPYRKRMLGIMTKIKDDSIGSIGENGKMKKTVTTNDYIKLNKGVSISKDILIKAGADPKSIIITKPRGAHPGGTAAIGHVVDNNQETVIKGLFVSDASVLPDSPGLPPILTIIALSKRLAKEFLRVAERREFRRLMKSLPVRITIDDKKEAELLPVITSNISEGGIFIETMNLREDFLYKLRVKSHRVTLIIDLPEWIEEIKLTAVLVWEKREAFPLEKSYGMGMKFTEIATNERNKLISYISEMSRF